MQATAPPESVLTLPTPDVTLREIQSRLVWPNRSALLFSFYNSAQRTRLSYPKHSRGGNGGLTQRQTVSYKSKNITSRDIDKLLFGRVRDYWFTNDSPELSKSKKCTFHHSHDKVKIGLGSPSKQQFMWAVGGGVASRPRGGGEEKHGALPTSSVLSRYH
jgi:hypothetical protein